MELEVKKIIGSVPFLTNLSYYVSINGLFSQAKIVRCDLYFFLIYINDHNNALDKCIVHHFADDTNLLFGNKCPSEISCVMNNELK